MSSPKRARAVPFPFKLLTRRADDQAPPRYDEEKHDLNNQHDKAQRKGRIAAVCVYRKKNRYKNVDDRKQRDQSRDKPAGQYKCLPELVPFIQIGDRVLCPAQHPDRHGNKIYRRIRKKQMRESKASDDPPQDIRYVINHNRKQKFPVHFPGRFIKSALSV